MLALSNAYIESVILKCFVRAVEVSAEAKCILKPLMATAIAKCSLFAMGPCLELMAGVSRRAWDVGGRRGGSLAC